jgi:hypothetical protein
MNNADAGAGADVDVDVDVDGSEVGSEKIKKKRDWTDLRNSCVLRLGTYDAGTSRSTSYVVRLSPGRCCPRVTHQDAVSLSLLSCPSSRIIGTRFAPCALLLLLLLLLLRTADCRLQTSHRSWAGGQHMGSC